MVVHTLGNAAVLAEKKLIAVVGTREISPYGKAVVDDLIPRLVSSGFVIVSGMARGVDLYAHSVAISCGGKTVGVVGFGFDFLKKNVYVSTVDRVLEGGAIVSPFEATQSPQKWTFIARNKLIAKLVCAVLIVEATKQSGVFSLVNAALELNKPIFVVPGSVFSYTSQGCHELIKEGAQLVSSGDDILQNVPNTV